MINRVTVVGRLTHEPELKYTPNGVAVINFSVAVQRPFKNQQGENEADFLRVTAWRKQAENVATYLNKGSLCGIDGRLSSRRYESEGRNITVIEIQADQVQFLESRRVRQGNEEKTPHEAHSGLQDDVEISDDDLPF